MEKAELEKAAQGVSTSSLHRLDLHDSYGSAFIAYMFLFPLYMQYLIGLVLQAPPTTQRV